MAKPLLFKIVVDDKGNPAIVKVTNNVEKLGKTTSRTGDLMKAALGSVAIIRGIALLNTGLRTATKNAVEFEASIKKISAITNTSGAGLNQLSTEARELAVETEHSANNITKAMLAVSKMGFTTEQTITAMSDALNLSTVSGSDLAESATDMVTILKAFNLEASESERVVNVIGTTVSQTALGFDDFREAMKFVAPIAQSLNISLEETAALMGSIGDVGLKGSIGGTTLKNMFLNLLKPTEKTAAFLKDFNTEGKSFADILQEMKAAGLDVKDFLDQFNKRAVAGTLAIAGMGDKVNKLEEDLVNQTRTMADMADEMRDVTIIQFQRMMNALNEVGLSIFDAFGSRPKSVIQALIDRIKDLDGWIDNNKDSIRELADRFIGFIKFIESIGNPALKVLVKNMEAFGTITATLFVASKVKVITNMVTAAGGLGPAFTKAAAGASLFNIALGAVGIVAAAVLITLQKMSDNVNKQTEALKEGFFSETTLDRLKRLRTAMGEVEKTQHLINNNYGEGAVSADLLNMQLDNQKQLVKDITKEQTDQFGKSAANALQDARSVETQIRGIQAKLDLIKKINEEEANQKKKLPRFKPPEPEVDSGKSAKDTKEKEKLWQEAQKKENEALEEWLDRQKKKEEVDNKNTEASFERIKKKDEKETEAELLARSRAIDTANFIIDTAGQVNDIVGMLIDNQAAKEQQAFDEKMQRIDRLHEFEVSRAGDSAFLKQMAEEKYLQKKNQLEDQYAKKAKERARQQKALAIAQAQVNTASAVVGALAQTQGGIVTREAAAIVAGLLGAVQIAAIAATPLRSGGIVGGEGNGTSDSNLFRGSKGERMLSLNDIDSLGGNSKIQQMIDRGDTYNDNSSKKVYIDTIIGTKEYVRDAIIPEIEMELSR